MTSIAIIGNVASLAYLIGRELRARGFEIVHYCTRDSFNTMPEKKYVYELDRSLKLPFERTVRKFLAKRDSKIYDLEIRMSTDRFVKASKSVIVYNGSDLRDGLMKPESRCFITTRDLFQYAQNRDVRFLPRCIDSAVFAARKKRSWDQSRPLIIGHFPTNKDIKGTQLFTEAVNLLRSRGYTCEVLSKVVRHEEMPDYLAQVDVLCDWFKDGIYGVISIESLSIGTPVVCYVKDEYFDYPEVKGLITNCELDKESIANAIITAVNRKFNFSQIAELYSPRNTVDILLTALEEWKMV